MKGSYKNIEDIKQIQDLMRSVAWDPRTKKQWMNCLKNSSRVYSYWDKEKLIGMGRLVTDTKYAMIYDVAVHSDYQNKGIGKKIILALMKKCQKGVAIGLFIENKSRLKKFYGSIGFQPIRAMQLRK